MGEMVKLQAVEVTSENFAPYGQVVGVREDGEEYGPHDAQLELSNGIPRFYIMRLRSRVMSFDRVTHHASVTQCLASVAARPWYLGVAPPSIVNDADQVAESEGGRETLKSKCGHRFTPPSPADVRVFKVEGPQFLKLHAGTWHAGPLFTDPVMDFYNLELSDTNVVDHTMHVFSKEGGVSSFQVVD